MEVRAGYKQTEAGVIPEDWKLSNLSALSAFITKGSTPTTYGFKWESSGVLFLRSECVAETGLDLSQSMFISDAAHASLRRSTIKEGDLLVTITGYVGRVVVFRGREDANINQHIARVRINSPLACGRFVYHYLSLPQVRSRFNAITTGQAYPQISLKQVRDTEIPLPPTKAEQEAIAEALSDADALIESLEQLLAKKRQLKQGAMQELLTGKKRLPGFSGEWEVKPFDGVLVRLNAKAHQIQTSDYQTTGRYPVVDQGKEPVIGFSDRLDKRFQCPAGGVIVFGDHTCIVKFIEFDFLVGADGTQVLQAEGGQCTHFHALQLQHRGVQPTGYNRHFKFLKEREFLTPPLPEQTAIAAVLSDMDAGIAALEAKLAKARQLKQGMMQGLLTGRIRLV